MAATLEQGIEEREEIRRWVFPQPVSFDEFLDLYMGLDDNVELVDGAVVERRMVQYDHEMLLMWLLHVTDIYVRRASLGIAFGSRSAVKIAHFRGRLPDMVFVSTDRLDIVKQKALFETPDLILEIRSPGNRKSHMTALETDYRLIGTREIVFIDPAQRRVRAARKRGNEYEIEERSDGLLSFETIPGLHLELDWLFDEPRPDVVDTVLALLESRGA